LNTNRNNNRRRGRGNNNRGGQGGGNQGNRIDSRARGNAPQLLEKYRKLAHDASLNDDRVQTEYYLQFADHYFRVLADSKVQRDDTRPRGYADRDDGDEDGQDDETGYYDRAQDSRGNSTSVGNGNGHGGGREQQAPQPQKQPQPQRAARPQPEAAEDESAAEGAPGSEGEEAQPAPENPFIRDARTRAPRSRERGRPRSEAGAPDRAVGPDGLDANSLPPAIASSNPQGNEGDEGTVIDGDAGEAPAAKPARAPRAAKPRAPRTRSRQSRPADDGDPETLEAVS